MKKKTYIAPEMVTVALQNRPLMQTVSGFNQEVVDTPQEPVSAGDGLAKSGGFWSDEPVDYEE